MTAQTQKTRTGLHRTRRRGTKHPIDTQIGIPLLIAGRSLADISRGTGLTASYVSRVTLGKRAGSIATWKKIAVYLGLSIEAAQAATAAARDEITARNTAARARAKEKAA